MNAFEVLKTTTNPGYWVCMQCRQPHDKKSEANECCLRFDEVLQLRERERFERAKKIPCGEWNGPVYCDGTGDDGYHENLSAFWDWWEDFERDTSPPPYVWACTSEKFAQIDHQKLLGDIEDKAPENFQDDWIKGWDELVAVIKKFNEANKDLVGWHVDLSTAVLLENGGRE